MNPPEPAPTPQQIIERVEAFMRAHLREALSIDRIAADAGCSIRWVQALHRQLTGETPMQRLRRLRLEQAHQDLISGEDTGSIAQIAARYHFSNPGRFAGQYRELFGRSPSRRDGPT